MRTRRRIAVLTAAVGWLALAVHASAEAPGSAQTGPGPAVGPSSGAGSGGFDAPPTRRDEGLPIVLAAVLVGGLGSLHVRLLLDEPAARRTPARRGPGTVATGG